LVKAPTVAAKVAVVDPAGTDTDAGTVKAVLLVARATVPPPVLDNVTVHVLEAELTGAQLSAVTVIGPLSAREVDREDPFRAPVIVADCSAPMAAAVAVNVAVVADEETATDAGTVTDGLLLESATVPPPVLERVTVQVVDAPPANVAAAQEIALTVVAVVKAIEDERDDPFNDAVTVALWSLPITPALAEKDAVCVPDGTVTEAGAISNGLLLARATVPPAALVRVTTQAVDVPPLNVAGTQFSAVIAGGAASAIEAERDDPFNDAVMVALWSVAITPAAAVNVAVATPAGTDMEPGTVTDPVLLDSVTTPPPEPATVTVHALDAPELNEDGAHDKPVTVVGDPPDAVTVPPVPVTGRACPSGEAAIVSAMAMFAVPDTVTLTTATTPFWIVFAFKPARIHLYSNVPLAQ
jgi:hypothetical protein